MLKDVAGFEFPLELYCSG